MVVIAHHPSAIAAVDKILVLQDGKTAAFGAKDKIFKRRLTPVRTQGAEQ